MKKILIAAILAVAVGGSAFAADASKLNYRIKTSFASQFDGAKDVNWTTRETFVKADFTLAGEKIEAFFSTDGELIATARKIQYGILPINALKKIQKKYPDAKVDASIEYEQDGEKSYFVALEDAGKKQILQVSLYGAVNTFKGK